MKMFNDSTKKPVICFLCCLQNTRFFVIIDETTDVSTCKELAIVTRHYDKQFLTVQSKLYDLLDVPQADAETLYQTLVDAIESDKTDQCKECHWFCS